MRRDLHTGPRPDSLNTRNENGLSWNEWRYAAAVPDQVSDAYRVELMRAWRSGEDPSDHRESHMRSGGRSRNRTGSSPVPGGNMTSREIGLTLVHLIEPLVRGTKFRVSNGEEPPLAGVADHVMVTWANVDQEASELDALNANKSIMLSIDAPEWHQSRIDTSKIGRTPVSKVTVHAFRGRSQRSFRGKTGTPKQVIESIYKWFAANADSTAQGKRDASARLQRNMAGGRKVIPVANQYVNLGNNEGITLGVVPNEDGTWTALTYSRSRTFKTQRGAVMWFRAAMPGSQLDRDGRSQQEEGWKPPTSAK